MKVPQFSLRTWIALPTVVVVIGLVLVLSAFQLENFIRAWINGSSAIAELAGQQVKQLLVARLEEVNHAAPATSIAELKDTWSSVVETDPGIAAILEASVARAASIVEISISDREQKVLASSNRARRLRPAVYAPSLEQLQQLSALDRLRWLFSQSSDYEFRIPIGLANETQPLFTIHVLVSNVLLREQVWPGLRRIGISGTVALALALLLVYGAAHFTVANLNRIGSMIDRIAVAGAEGEVRPVRSTAEEFAAVESKLTLLGDRVRGALHDAEAYKQNVAALLDRLKEAILLFDADRVVLSSGAVEPLLGRKASDVFGRALDEIFPPDREPGASLQQAWRTGEAIHDQRVPWQAGEKRRRLLVNVDFIADPGNPGHRLGLLRLRDEEGAGALETELQILSRLEAINRLTGGVAHEIKNPLNSISARLALLESIVAEEVPEATQQIQVISEEIYRLDRVVRTFLDFTQPLEIQHDRVDMAVLLNEIVELLCLDAANRNVRLSCTSAQPALPIRGDKDLLKQAIMNLVLNGVDAMPNGGELRIDASEQSGVCRIAIADTGVGIPEALRSKVFQLYFTTKKNGSGIGLATAYRTVQLHGGSLTVESEVDRGTRFDIALPAYRPEVVNV